MLDKKQISAIFLFAKMGHKTAETTLNIRSLFGLGSADKCTVQQWFERFCKEEENLEDKECSGQPLEVNSDHLRAIIEANPLKTTGEIAEELNIDHSMIILVFEANWKSEKAP